MAENTKIKWADHTYNHWIGCTKVGPGCDHCYAEREWDDRRHRVVWGSGQPRSRTKTANQPVRWNNEHEQFFAEHGRRQRVFCSSLSDVFDNEVDPLWRLDLFRLIHKTTQLDWLLLTKRIGNVMTMIHEVRMLVDFTAERDLWLWLKAWENNEEAPANVWLGATIVNQAEADRDIKKLVYTPAAIHFLSMEPLLGAVDIRKWLGPWTCADCGFHGSENDCGPAGCERCGEHEAFSSSDVCTHCGADDQSAKPSCPSCGSFRSFQSDHGFKFDSERKLIDWVIVGGESGPEARPMLPAWVDSLRDQCRDTGTPFLFKQWGEWHTGFVRMGDNAAVFRQFDSFQHWVNKASTWVNGGICLDRNGQELKNGRDMARARDEGLFPVTIMHRVGVKHSGDLLNGEQWNQVPASVHGVAQ